MKEESDNPKEIYTLSLGGLFPCRMSGLKILSGWTVERKQERKGKKSGAQISGVNSTSWQRLDGVSEEEEAQREMQSGEEAERLEEMVEIRARRTRGGRGRRREML